MRRHEPIFILCFLTATLLAPSTAMAQSATGQLESLTGTKITRYQRQDEHSSSQSSADLASAPIVVAPVFTVVGIFYGGHWFYCHLAGKYDQFFLASYLEHAKFKSAPPDPSFDNAASFGMFLGGLPWVVAFPAGLAIKIVGQGFIWSGVKAGQGVAWAGGKVADVFKKPDPSPVIRQYDAIANTYGQLAAEAEVNLKKKRERVEAAQAACERHLSRFINEQPDLRALADTDPAAARERARKRLDAYVVSLNRHEQAAHLGAKATAELEKMRNEAGGPLREQLHGILMDSPMTSAQTGINTALSGDMLTKAERKFLRSERRIIRDAGKIKGFLKTGIAAKKIFDDWEQSENAGVPFSEWLNQPATKEKLGRLGLGMLGGAGDIAEKSLDLSYAAVANIVLTGKIDSIRRENERLWAMSSKNDHYARAWIRQMNDLNACQRDEASAKTRMERYQREKTEYEKKASDLR